MGGSPLVFLPLTLTLLLLSPTRAGAQPKGSPLDCQKTCVCASNIISCSKAGLKSVPAALPAYTAVLDLSYNNISRLRAEWTTVNLGNLHSLLLSHNGLNFLSSEAFANVIHLRHLDLSSNGLVQLDEGIFEPLEQLESLLLYDNAIAQIDRAAFSGLVSLRKLYLSRNLVSRFPLELVKERTRSGTLALLDVSSNRIKQLPPAELSLLPAWVADGLYLHDNPLPCSCQLYNTLARWQLKGLSSVVDFAPAHTCVLPGAAKLKVATLELNKAHLNCSEVGVDGEEEAYLEQYLVLDCDSRRKDTVKTWTLPNGFPVSNPNAMVTPDGRLQIGPLKVEDSGVYTCNVTAGDSFEETLYVTVVVFNSTARGGLENMKTAYTTLVACLVSLVMVLVYLYLTPCRCAHCPGQGAEKEEDSLRSSTVSISHDDHDHDDHAGVEGGGGGGGGGNAQYRHVAFTEPKEQLEQNGRLDVISEKDEEAAQGDQRQRRSDVSSVCSDTPMML